MVYIKSKNEIQRMKEGGKIIAKILKKLISCCQINVSAQEIEAYAQELIRKAGGKPAFQYYEGYPAATCISINDEVVHSVPRKDKIFKDGDVIGIDIGLDYLGMFTDTARTVGVGTLSQTNKELIRVTREALDAGIKQTKAGNKIGDISHAVQSWVEKKGFNVVRSLVGHGVGRKVHEDPRIPNFGEKNTGLVLKEGMTLAIEPMVTVGKYDVYTEDDGWTIKTVDGSYSAHFEDTIAITKKGCTIITR